MAAALYIVARFPGAHSFGQTLHMVTGTWLPYPCAAWCRDLSALGGRPLPSMASPALPRGPRGGGGTGTLSAGRRWGNICWPRWMCIGPELVLLVLGVMTWTIGDAVSPGEVACGC